MTVYSQHPQRGKVQILATYRGWGGMVASTVTSVESSTAARLIVDAFNRVSACATVPVSVHDERDRQVNHYPSSHLAALTDPAARVSLLEGTHSLWYEQVMWQLHEALTDLDAATAAVPAPVRTAVEAELETEVRWLAAALAEYSEGVEIPEDEAQRVWDFENPIVVFDERTGLGRRDRIMLDHVEAGADDREVHEAIIDERLLLDVAAQTGNVEARLRLEDLSIAAEPEDPDGFFLSVEAPLPGADGDRAQWGVAIDRWEADELDEDGYPVESHSEPVIRCVLATRPAMADVLALLDLTTSQEKLAAWAQTPVGEALRNTVFVVTERCTDEG
ncbi:hypothetical protein [Amycolatopsis echigonensis]|uniref:Uncharacterized protein n=2 Tax=Amycolatopsis TaxID=1813 RepID=A0A8E1VUB7_9PSEU|nr:hypothetical protein [Amycolatopsis echigonensis]MBB2498432.1 hypothetical protein [Amycolatopsis echigonensis]